MFSTQCTFHIDFLAFYLTDSNAIFGNLFYYFQTMTCYFLSYVEIYFRCSITWVEMNNRYSCLFISHSNLLLYNSIAIHWVKGLYNSNSWSTKWVTRKYRWLISASPFWKSTNSPKFSSSKILEQKVHKFWRIDRRKSNEGEWARFFMITIG